MSDNSDGTAQPGSSSQPPLTETITSVSAQIGQGDVGAWNFDNIEDKNPFSEFSEEHLNKLDEVLSSVEVREILQQSATDFNLDMSLEDGNQPGNLAGSSQPIELQEADLSVLSAAFSDHAYAVPPSKAPKTKPVVVTTTERPKPVVVTVGPSEIPDVPMIIRVPPMPSIMPQAAESPSPPMIEVSPPSPVSVSPRKSGRPAKSKRYGDEEWVTSSPRGRGRGRGSRTESPIGFGSLSYRQSSRISDQKQRELAEKILQANRQALEAEKLGGAGDAILGVTEQPEGVGRGRGRKPKDEDDDFINVDDSEGEEKSPGKGRGRGRGRGRPKKDQDEVQKVGKTEEKEEMVIEKTEDEEADKETGPKEELKMDTTVSSQDEISEDIMNQSVSEEKQTGEDVKSGEESHEETDSEEEKKKPVRKKPKKSVWETKRRKKKKKPVKKKIIVKKTEETVTSEYEGESDSDIEEKVKVAVKAKTLGKGKKLGKVKGKLKGKKLKVKIKKGKSKQEDSESSDLETGKKFVGKKKVKKLTKQELVQRLKDAKMPKKTKLLEKKKAKLKEKKGKLKASGTESDKSPKKKKDGKETADSDITSDKQETPKAKKKITKKTKDKEEESDVEEKTVPKGKKKGLVAETASPTKKKKGKLSEEKQNSGDQSLVKKKKGKMTKDTADSESKDSPKKKKGKQIEDKTDSESPSSPKKKKGKQPAVKVSEESEGEQKGKKVLKGKKAEAEPASEPDSPQKKKKGKLKGEKVEEDKTELDTKKSPTKAGKRKDLGVADTVSAKKQKTETLIDKSEAKVSLSDSDEDVPLKKIKKDLQEDSESKEEKKDSHEIQKETSDTKTLEQTKEQIEQSLKSDVESKVNETVHASDMKTDDSKVGTESQVESKDTGKTADSVVEKKESVSEIISAKVDKSDDKKDNKRKLSLDKDSFETPSKRRDSRDSKDSRDDKSSSHHRHRHHSHHRHRHSRDSRESASEERRHSLDKKDSHKDRRKHSHSSSHERKKSDSGGKDKERRDSHDRKSSVSKDRRDSLKDLPLGKSMKKGERRSSIASVNSDQKDIKTPAKIEKKKSRKSEDIPVDSSWIDLFKPDVTPKQKDKIKSEQSVEDNGSTPLKDVTTVSVDAKSDSENVEITSSFEDTEKVKESSEQKVSKENLDTVSILDRFKDITKESDKTNIVSEDTNKGEKDSPSEIVLDAKEDASDNMKVENLVDIKTEAQSSSDNLLKALDSDNLSDATAKVKKADVVSEKGITEETEKVKKSKVEGENAEKVKIGDSEFHIVKIPVSSMVKKEKSPKESTDKKAVDKAKLLKNLKAKLSGDKDKKRDSKDKTEGKAEKAKGLSTDKTKKLSPVRKGIMKKVTPEKKLTESAKKRRLSGEGTKKRELSGDSVKKRHVSGEGKARPSRNKSVAFAEILKKEKLGSDDEESDNDSDFNDDETDETWEEPGKLYCLCRQPHNQRFMICCDKCEEWFHGKCVGISRARGEEMEKNDEEYICPQCSEKEYEAEEKEDKTVVTSTESPEQPHKKAEMKTTDSKERVSLFESLSTADTTSSLQAVEKSELPEIAKPDSTVSSPVKRDSLDSETSAKGKPAGEHTPTKVKHGEGDSPRKVKSPDGDKGNVGYIRKRSPKKDTTGADKKKMIKSFEPKKPKVVYSQRKCICGCNRLAKIGSQYSTKECEIRRAEQRKEENEAAKKAPVKVPQERRVAVVEKGTGKTLTGHKAPRESELKDWLQKHPTFEVLKSHRRLSLQSQSSTAGPSKDRASDSSEVSDKEKSGDDSRSEKPLPEGPEPVRLNVRKGLRDALAARADAAEDIVLSNSEIKGLSLAIEEEMFNCFKDTDHKYKAKYRSLVFNIKDHKNNGLFRKILNRRIRPNQLVRMTPEELASQELTKWREHEAKHQLEMIEQTEAELQQEHPHITKKTHKGEVEVEEEGEEDLSSLSVAEPKKEAPKIDPKADVLSVILPDTTEQHGKHLFDSNCRVCTGKIVPHTESSDTTSKTTVVVTEPKPEEEEEEPTQKEKDLQAEEVVKEVLKAIKKAQAEVQREALESQKKANAVTVRSPDSALSSGLEKKVKFTPSGPQLWKGFVYMQDVSKFVTSAYRVTGPADNLDLPDTIHVCGRINPEHVWDYLSKIKQAASRDICVIRFIPGNNEEKVAYINLYSYLNSRSRCGVVANSAKHIKDFYIVPLASHSKIPAVLKPFDGPGLEENRCHMLIGVIIRNKVKPGTASGISSQTHKQDPRKLKSNLKDPAGDDKSTSSTSSSPTSSASSLTPQEKKKKAKSISFDPIVKEYSHVSSDQEEPDVTYDPNAPYDPEKEAETTTPKQEDKPYSPSQGEVLGISELLKTSHKHKSKEDTVSKMIEKIALSKNPIEATATMVAALATSSRLGNQNQRKLLLELTKKVDEQKKLLEQKRISSKSGRSPSSISSTTSPSPSEKATHKSGLVEDSPSTSGSSPHSNKSQLNKNDPRLKSKDTKTSESKEPSASVSSLSVTESAVSDLVQETAPTVYSPHKDLQATKAAQVASRLASSTDTESVKTTGTKDSVQSSPTKKLFSFILKPKSHTVSKSVIEDENETKSSLHKLDEEIETVVKPKGFYVDHGEKVAKEHDKSKDLTVSKAESLKTSSEGGAWKVVTNDPSEPGQTASVLDKLNDSKEGTSGTETISAKLDSDLKESSKVDSEKHKVTDSKSGLEPAEKEDKSHSDKGYDIVSQLQAEVSGASQKESQKPGGERTEDKEAFDILSQLHASVWGAKGNKDQNKESSQTVHKAEAISKSSLLETDSSKSSVKLPPNILNILKEVTDKPSAKVQPKQEDSQQSGQLPNALMSLFSKMPSSSKTDSEIKSEPSVVDEDLRLKSKKRAIAMNVSASQKLVNPALEAKAEIKVSKDKLTKSFLGFDYDSDSDSEGSFEGFDDDGVKSLSPRKRKLVAKQSPIISQSVVSGSMNEYGDVDIRVKPKPEDDFEFPSEDVDLRQMPTSTKLKQPEHEKTSNMVEDTGVAKENDKVDKDERVQQEPGIQPQPPGEELGKYEFPIDIDERIKRRVPPGVVFTTPDTDKMGIRPPVLSDVDHRKPGFPGPIPPGLRPLLPFVGSNQPPPPGEDWQPGQPAPPPLPLAPLVKPPPLPEGLPPPPPEQPKVEETKSEKEKDKIEEKDKDDRTAEETKELAADESEVKEKKVKKNKKEKKEKKKGGPLTSDERLKAIVLEIARKEPIEPPPLPPILKPSVPLPMPMPVFSGPPPLSCPPGPMISAPGPIFTEPPTLSAAAPPPVASTAMPYSTQGSSMPLLTPETSHPPRPWQGPPVTSSTGPPSLFEIDVKPPGKRPSRPPKLQPADRVNPSPPPLPQNFTPSKQGLLPTPVMPPANQIPQPANQSQGQGPLGPMQPLVGPNTVSSIGPPPMGMKPRGSIDSPRIGQGDDSYPPPLLPEVKGFSDERDPEDRGPRHRDRHDRHSRNRDDDRDRHRHGRHRDDTGHRSSRDRHDRSDRRSSDRHRDDHHRDDYHRDEGRGRDDDRRRDRSRSRDDHHGHRHKRSRH